MIDIGTLRQRQSLPLDAKIIMTQERIRAWYAHWDGAVHVCISGKDSLVVLDIARKMYPGIKAVFSDTGLEYPEVRDFALSVPNVDIVKPRKNFAQVTREYGYPCPSKEQAKYIYELRHTNSARMRTLRLDGKGRGNSGMISTKWLPLVHAPFDVSDKCCDWLKKKPLHEYVGRTDTYPITGITAAESRLRLQDYMANGCNLFNAKWPQSRPISFWREQDVWDYVRLHKISLPKLYDMGYDRTGCMFCMFGIASDPTPNRFQRMAVTHPKQYRYCIETLGIGQVLDFIGIPYRNLQGGLFDE